MDKNLTIIYATAHKIPDTFREKVFRQLKKAASDYPITELHTTPEQGSIVNYYRQLLEAAKGISTPYLAFAEDDTLYPDEHFNQRPSSLDTFAYNFTRWNIYTWSEPPFFSLRQRKILATLIAPRELFIQAFEDKFRVDPEGKRLHWWGEPGRTQHEKALGIPLRKSEDFMTYNPIVVFSHPNAHGYESNGKSKRASKIRALELPYHGTAKEVRALWP